MKTRRVFFHFFSKVDAGELFFACFSFYRILKNELLEMARQAAKLRENLRNKENAIMLLTEQVTRQEERAAASRPTRNGSQRSLPDTEDQVQKMRVRLIIFRAPTLNGIDWHWMALNGIDCHWMPLDAIGWHWMALNGIGCHWMALNAIGCHWMALDHCGMTLILYYPVMLSHFSPAP